MNSTPHQINTVFMEILDVGLVILADCCGRTGRCCVGACWNGYCGICAGVAHCGGVTFVCGETVCGI